MARLIFDPLDESPSNAPLDVWTQPDGSLSVIAMDFPEPPLDLTASSVTEGDLVVSRRHQNRQITVTVDVLEPNAPPAANLVSYPTLASLSGYTTSAGPVNAGGVVSGPFGTAPDQYGFLVADNASVDLEGVSLSVTGPFDAGVTYYFGVDLIAFAGNTNVGLYIGNALATDVSTQTVAINGAAYTRHVLAWTPASTYATAVVAIRNPNGVGVSSTVQWARVAVSTAQEYFDGDTPGCAWTGTPHASLSTRPASGGPRFRAIVADLQAKAAKLALNGEAGRPSGTLRWVNDDNERFTFDIVAQSGGGLPYDITYFAGPAARFTFNLTALPYARGAEVSYSSHTETTLPVLTFTETGVPGDVPALGRLVITEAQAANQKTVVWGMESRHLGAAPALFLQGESGTLATNVAATAEVSAVGGSMARYSPGSTSTSFGGRVTFNNLTHHGTYRVLVRAKASSATFKVRLQWWPDVYSQANNGGVGFTATTGVWRILDLGVITATGDLPYLIIESTAVSGQTLDIDWVLLVPVAEGHGQATASDPAFVALPASGFMTIDHESVVSVGSAVFRPPYEGDYLKVPPAGPEGRSVRFVIKASRGIPGVDSLGDTSAADDITAQLIVTPRFLGIR